MDLLCISYTIVERSPRVNIRNQEGTSNTINTILYSKTRRIIIKKQILQIVIKSSAFFPFVFVVQSRVQGFVHARQLLCH